MRRAWLLWSFFLICLAVGVAAMGWISITVLRLEGGQQVEENVRLALWRMDSALAPLVAQETARPYFAYTAFTPAERAYTRMFGEIRYGDVLVPSPILVNDAPLIRLHFQFGPDGTLSSPQAPTGNQRDLASKHYTTREKIRAAAKLLEEFAGKITQPALAAVLPPNKPEESLPVVMANPGINGVNSANGGQFNFNNNEDQPQAIANAPAQQVKGQMAQAEQRSRQERQARDINRSMANSYEYITQRGNDRLGAGGGHVREGVMQALWVGDSLVLARRVTIDDADYIQGVWLNWPAVRADLLARVADLLPAASLEPCESEGAEAQPRRMASLPVRLAPGAMPPALLGASPIRMTLAIAWACVLMGSAAVALLLWGALSLSERRGAFVSAVTHELRTPLTTVSMYAEMLQEQMVSDEGKRREYLATLRSEAERLGHLVENVLAYSRIERGRARTRIGNAPLGQLIDGVRGRLAERARQAGMELVVELNGSADAAVRTDASAVEQVLFNLVDNAGKYAASATDRRIHVDAERNGRCMMIRVRDHGPGISAADARKLFRPFSKSARDAANSAPGVGLGLALSRRLARQVGGDLRLERGDGGACFVLTVPVAA